MPLSSHVIEKERDPNHKVKIESSPKWIRVIFGGETVADSKKALILFETGFTPVYYFPEDDVRMDLLRATDKTSSCPYKGNASYWSVVVGEHTAEDAVWKYTETYDDSPEIQNYVAFYWDKLDRWFEEEEEIFVHPRDPYKRIDVVNSSRHVKIVLNDTVIAETSTPTLLFETGLPVRYYLRPTDIRMDLLLSTEKATHCPYKGACNYYSVNLGDQIIDNLAWYYRYPTLEAAKIAGLVAFFNERVELYIDGDLQEKPKTKWSIANSAEH